MIYNKLKGRIESVIDTIPWRPGYEGDSDLGAEQQASLESLYSFIRTQTPITDDQIVGPIREALEARQASQAYGLLQDALDALDALAGAPPDSVSATIQDLPLTDQIAVSQLLSELSDTDQQKVATAFSRGDDIRAVLSGLAIGNEASSAYALIIGVNGYPNLNGKDLKGAENDARAHALTLRAMGVPAENIRVLLSEVRVDEPLQCDVIAHGRLPARLAVMQQASFGILDGRQRRAATYAGIQRGLGWLHEKLYNNGVPNNTAQGFVFFSGHGTLIGDQPAICPCDIPDTPVPGSSVFTLEEIFGAVVAPSDTAVLDDSANLTVVLDVCLTEQGSDRNVSSDGSPSPSSSRKRSPRASDVVLMSCAPHERSLEGVFDNRWHGSFSWALSTVLQQRDILVSSSGRAYNIGYQELIERVNMLLSALGYPQHANTTIRNNSSEDAHLWPVFGHGSWAFRDAHTIESVKLLQELDGGIGGYVIYDIRAGLGDAGNSVGKLVVTGKNMVSFTENTHTYNKNTEYWFWPLQPFAGDFTLVPVSSVLGNLPASNDALTKAMSSKPFPNPGANPDPTGPVPSVTHIIRKKSPTDVMGYLKHTATSLEWYRKGSIGTKLRVLVPYRLEFKSTSIAPPATEDDFVSVTDLL